MADFRTGLLRSTQREGLSQATTRLYLSVKGKEARYKEPVLHKA